MRAAGNKTHSLVRASWPSSGGPFAALFAFAAAFCGRTHGDAGWSSPVARQAHNLKVVGSNPTPATTETPHRPQKTPRCFQRGCSCVLARRAVGRAITLPRRGLEGKSLLPAKQSWRRIGVHTGPARSSGSARHSPSCCGASFFPANIPAWLATCSQGGLAVPV